MTNLKPYILVVVLALIIGAIYFLNATNLERSGSQDDSSVKPRVSSQEKAKRYELAKEITTPDGFINTNGDPITMNDYIGKKIILVDFWTYSCINCQRTTPYLNAWYEKYQDKGLVIIGIHTPEFEFEKDYQNVQEAVKKFGIQYPVVLDNDYSTWTVYQNHYWPRKYLIDIDGYIIYDHIGEGAYEKTEQKIQEALEERMAVLGEQGGVDEALTPETPVIQGAQSPETYFGASRNGAFANGKSGVVGNQNSLQIPSDISPNELYLSGNWNITEEFAQNTSVNARIVYRYTAKDVFFVAEADKQVIVEVWSNGKPLNVGLGKDVTQTADGKATLLIKEAGLYKIIQHGQSETHTLELRIQTPGLKSFTFTFG